MPLASCARCNKMFSKLKSPVCLDCEAAEAADREKVLGVLELHSDLNPEQVAELADVDVSVVRRMVGEGVVAQLTPGERPICGRCGAPAISLSKKLCQACLDKLNTEVSRAQSNIQLARRKAPEIGQKGVRMTFDDKRK
ncbi:MAG: hypothetical protein KF886_10870 [Candidatus Hydrogenedentes bacterium]|nr:hypothetical protein [Candidatus Hydrogenedentota bacterium]